MGDLIVRGRQPHGRGRPAASAPSARRRRGSARLTEEVTRIEGRADELYDEGLKAPVPGPRAAATPMDFIVGTEIYDHLEKVVDRFEDVANEIHSLVIEHV